MQTDKTNRFIQITHDTYLDSLIYQKRLTFVIEPFLLDANDRGKQENKKVYCHIVGLGLGVWQITSIQAKLMLEAYTDIIKTKNLTYISDIDFSWFPKEYQTCGGLKDGEVLCANNNLIKIHFSKRNPVDKLDEKNAGKLLVAMYAWDGNAYPGNEYWCGHLTASGDPAAASCSTIVELQNPLINPRVSAENLFIVV